MIEPAQTRLLVQLKGKYKNLESADEKYGNSKTRGIVLAIAPDITPAALKKIGLEKLKVGDLVYFGAFEDTARYGSDDDQILIKLEEIGGRSDADA